MNLLPLLLLISPVATAGSSSGGEEFLSAQEVHPPNIIFLVDLSTNIEQDCGPSGSPSGVTCYDEVIDAIDQLVQHNDWANYGVVGSDDISVNSWRPIAPVGSTAAEIVTAFGATSTGASSDFNLAEAVSFLADEYLTNTSTGNADPWDDAPIEASCQETHIITIGSVLPAGDSYPTHDSSTGMTVDEICLNASYGDRDQCAYDNVAYNLFNNFDARGDLSDDQYVTLHTVGLKVAAASQEDLLFQNASDEIGGAGVYTNADSGAELIARLSYVLTNIRQGSWSRAAPVIAPSGDRMIATWYEILADGSTTEDAGTLLAQGHVRAYAIDDDDESATYGEVLYNGDSNIDGALWDAGVQLTKRPVVASESNPMDQDGFGQRDVFTYEPYLASLLPSTDLVFAEDAAGTQSATRMNFDASFVDAVDTAGRLWVYLNYLFAPIGDHDFDGDSDVDIDDLQELVDFARGVETTTFRYLDLERGDWRLGDSPNAVPAVVTARNQSFSNDPTYRRFLKGVTAGQKSDPERYPDMVLVPANDGMLHAFALRDYTDPDVGELGSEEDSDQAGEELWAWVPASVLYERDGYMGPNGYLDDWGGSLVDLMLYGRTSMLDGHVVVEDVWIDDNNDGVKSCDLSSFPFSCEWRRIAVVQQGNGGPATMALDITIPTEPEFLWEHPTYYDALNGSPTPDPTSWARTVSKPVIVNLDDRQVSGSAHDRWVALWGQGRAVPLSIDANAYEDSEPNLHFWHVSADVRGANSDGVIFDLNGSNEHPESTVTSGLDSDGDGRYEYGYISGAITAIDADSDGDVDTLYFPVTASYEPSDQGDPNGSGTSGLSDIVDPGATWMYKAIIDTADPDDPTWCEFIDPTDHGVVDADGDSYRPEVYYGATASWHEDGTLGVYWGSGTPYDRQGANPGYFFGFTDPNPKSCSSTPTALCGGTGVVTLAAGEGLTGEPIVYAGVVYFPTYEPGADTCSEGQGRVWGLDYETCGAGIDSNSDGIADTTSIDTDGYPSTLSVTDQGNLVWTGSGMDAGNIADLLGPGDDPFRGVNTLMLKEIF